jgi:hypothetical protein
MKVTALLLLTLLPLLANTVSCKKPSNSDEIKNHIRWDKIDKALETNYFKQAGKNSIAIRYKNPGNLRSPKSGKYREFKSLKDGYEALHWQIEHYKSGRSRILSPQSDLKCFANRYAPESSNYAQSLQKWLKIESSTMIKDIHTDSLVMCIIRKEDVRLWKLIYRQQD